MATLPGHAEDALWHEVKALMDDPDEEHQQLSSDEEGYVDRLMSGQHAPPVRAWQRPSTALPPTSVRGSGAVVSGGEAFQRRMLAAFDALQPGSTALPPAAGNGRRREGWGGDTARPDGGGRESGA